MRSRVAFLVLFALLFGEGARADEAAPARLEVFVRYGLSWVGDRSFELVSENDLLPQVEIGLGHAPGWLGGELGLELSYGFGESEAPLFGVADSRLDLHAIRGGTRYTFLRPGPSRAFVGAGAELSFATLTLEERTSASQTRLLFGLHGLLGYELALPFDPGGPSTGPGLLLSAETGYLLYPSPARFDELRHRGSEELKPAPIATTGIDAGSLDLSGWLLRFGAGVRF